MINTSANCDAFGIYRAAKLGILHHLLLRRSDLLHIHYSDVIMGAMASQITSLTIVYSIQGKINENIKAPRHWPLCGEFTGDRWIRRTNGQWRGKCYGIAMTAAVGRWKVCVEACSIILNAVPHDFGISELSHLHNNVHMRGCGALQWHRCVFRVESVLV